MKELIQAVKNHAVENYDKGGWDIIVECWGDDDIAEYVKGAKTAKQAIARFRTVVSVWADQQADARNSSF